MQREQRTGGKGVEPVLVVELRRRTQCAQQQAADVGSFLDELPSIVDIRDAAADVETLGQPMRRL